MYAQLLFVVLNGAALFASAATAARLYRGAELPRFLLAAVATWLVLTHSVVLGCGVAGVLTREVVAGVVGAAAVAAAGYGGRPLLDRLRGWPVPAAGRAAGWGAALAAGYVLCLLAWHGYHAVWTPLHILTWDDQAYHAVYPMLWTRAGGLGLDHVPLNYKAYYPQSNGLIAAWFLLPWGGESVGGMAWVGLTAVPYYLLFLLGVAALVARCGGHWSGAVPPAVLFLTSDRIADALWAFSDVDLAFGTLQFASLVFAVSPAGGAGGTDTRRPDTGFAALTAGLAVGTRATALLPAVVVCGVWVYRWWAAGGWRGGARAAAACLACGALTGGYWYVRNLLLTGNPVYPAAVAGLPGATTFPGTRLVDFAARYGWGTTATQAVLVYAKWPLAYGLAAGAGAVGLVAVAARARTAGPAVRAWAGLVAGTAVVVLAPLPWQPFSAGWQVWLDVGAVHPTSQRYILVLALAGWASVGLLLGPGGVGSVGRAVGLVLVLVVSFLRIGPVERQLMTAAGTVAVAAALMLAVRAGAGTPRPLRRSLAVVAVGATAAVVLFCGRHPEMAARSRENQLVHAFAALDREPDGARLWAYSPYGNQWVMALYGTRFQHTPVGVDQAGRRADRPEYEMDLFGLPPPPPGVGPAEFVRNLRAAGLTHVVTYNPTAAHRDPRRRGSMPPQHDLLTRSGEAERVAEGDGYVLWRLPTP